MRNAAFVAFGLFLVLLQSNLYPLFAPLGINGATPSLLLPLVIFLGVHEPSMARGALLASALGYMLDLFASAPIGLFAFVYPAIWWLSRVVGVRLTAQAVLTKFALAFLFALVESTLILILLAVFGSDPQRPLEVSRIIVAHATSTGIGAVFVFRIAERLHQGTLVAQHSTEGGKA
jgi:rod shape-determining protein MreD